MFVLINGEFYPVWMLEQVGLVETPRCAGGRIFYEKSGLVILNDGENTAEIEIDFVDLVRLFDALELPLELILN